MFRRKRVIEAAEPTSGGTTPERKLLMMSRNDAGQLLLIGKAPTGELEVWTAYITPAIAPVQVPS